MENKFVTDVVNLIQNKNAKKSIQAELESHILDKADYYMDIGYSKDEAFRRATEEMGDAEETAVPLNRLNNNPFNTVFNILSFALLVAIIIFYNKTHYHFSYAGNATVLVPHFVSFDFISTLIFSCYILLLWLSYKQKNKAVPIMIILSFVSIAFFSFEFTHWGTFQNSPADILSLFQPMSYAMINIFTKGFSQYINSIFGYSYVFSNNFNLIAYNTLSIIFLLIILTLAVLIIVSIYRQERMLSSRKIIHIYKPTLKILSLFVALNILIMSVCTVIAYNDIENKIAESKINRKQMIEYVFNADTTIKLEEQLNEIEEAGFGTFDSIASESSYRHIPYAYQRDNNLIKISPLLSDDYDKYEIIFDATNEENSILDKNMLCDENDKAILESYHSGDTLEKFLQNDIYAKACEVSNYYNTDYDTEYITFAFAFYEPYYAEHFEEWYDITYYYINFENGILIEY